MGVVHEIRPSDSPFVENIGRFYVDEEQTSVCPAGILWNMLIVRHKGVLSFSVWGPETKSAVMHYRKDAELFFIRFKLGTYLSHIPAKRLVDGGIILPEGGGNNFWLNSATWEFPTFENADTFVNRLVCEGIIEREPVVDAVLQGKLKHLPPRTVQRRFLHATGMSQRDIRQIRRAQQAAALLERGVSILDTVHAAGYFDQPQLTRDLKTYIGQTPAQIARAAPVE